MRVCVFEAAFFNSSERCVCECATVVVAAVTPAATAEWSYLQDAPQRPADAVPHAHCVVLAGGRQCQAVGGEGDRLDPAVVADQDV